MNATRRPERATQDRVAGHIQFHRPQRDIASRHRRHGMRAAIQQRDEIQRLACAENSQRLCAAATAFRQPDLACAYHVQVGA